MRSKEGPRTGRKDEREAATDQMKAVDDGGSHKLFENSYVMCTIGRIRLEQTKVLSVDI
jgi:hypothetical protein